MISLVFTYSLGDLPSQESLFTANHSRSQALRVYPGRTLPPAQKPHTQLPASPTPAQPPRPLSHILHRKPLRSS